MTHQEIRKKFQEYFASKGHAWVPSSPLLPDDPSVLFTTAGMQQFKPYYTGAADAQKDFGATNTASIQKCVRTSDIDEVGDERHLTFFEMLGNFSFGGYFKEEAIRYAHEFVTKEMGLTIDYVSVFKGEDGVPADEESERIWKSLDPAITIKKFGRADNFWGPTGDEGPCGPTTEIYVNGIEIWNVVFNQYFQQKDKTLTPLKTPGIDTGMGLERLALVSQFPGQIGKKTVFDTDLLQPIMSAIIEILGDKPVEQVRLIADHLRAAVFMIADGIYPGKDERNYIPRRLIRRAMSAHYLYIGAGLNKDFFRNPVNVVIDNYHLQYPYLKEKREEILLTIQQEAEKFSKVLTGTVGDLKKIYNRFIGGIDPEKVSPSILVEGNTADLDGAILFKIRETHGVGLEIMRMVMEKWGFRFSTRTLEDYNKAYYAHQEKSRAGAEKKFGGHGLLLDTGELKAANEEELKTVTRLHTTTHLLQAALRKVLGDEVHQAGSDITVERTRFDFTFPRKLTPEELKQVEDLVNDAITRDLSVTKVTLSREEAEKTGALHFFKIKYPSEVDVYSVGDFSKEFCGGPHVTHTGEIGPIRIVKEEAVSAGVRRIRASLAQ